jgi:site-specific recombinase XerD
MTHDEIEGYLDRFVGRRAPSQHTVKAYRSDLRAYARFATAQGLSSAWGETILEYIRALQLVRGAAPRTVRRRLAALRGYFKDRARGPAGLPSPFQELDIQLPRPRSLPRALSREEATILARAARCGLRAGGLERGQRAVLAAILTLTSVGLRIGELAQLQRGDFHAGDGGLHVCGKGNRDRRVFLVDAELRSELAELARGPADAALFAPGGTNWSAGRLREAIKAFARDAGVVRKVTPHMLRHTSATLLLEDGVDLLFLQRMLGHENIATTALYARVNDASLRQALERAALLGALAA